LVKTMLLLEDIEESSSPDIADDNVGCILVHDGFAMTSKNTRKLEHQMGRRKHISVNDQARRIADGRVVVYEANI